MKYILTALRYVFVLLIVGWILMFTNPTKEAHGFFIALLTLFVAYLLDSTYDLKLKLKKLEEKLEK